MTRSRTSRILVNRWEAGVQQRRPDELIVEEPLEIHLDGHLVATTMRTPGDDYELAVGFLHTEGLLAGAPIERVRYCATGSAVDSNFNVVTVDTGGKAPTPTPRLTTATSSCGLCGSATLTELETRLAPIESAASFLPEQLLAAPVRLAGSQSLFQVTGAVHAAVAFGQDGEPVVAREDVGRHNAVDKVVGRLLLDAALPAGELALYVSGRASFEIVQKAWAAGFGTIVAVSAPTALAVDTARSAGMTLAGFVRGDSLNLYC